MVFDGGKDGTHYDQVIIEDNVADKYSYQKGTGLQWALIEVCVFFTYLIHIVSSYF